MKRRWWNVVTGDTWLGVAFALWLLSLPSGFVALSSGFYFDPDDYSSDYYAAQIPRVVAVMVVSVLIPAASALAAGLSMLAAPRHASPRPGSVIVLLLALAGVWFCCWIGIEAIQTTVGFAEHSPK